MRIILVNSNTVHSGIGRYLNDLYVALKGEGITVEILTIPQTSLFYRGEEFIGKVIEPRFRNPILASIRNYLYRFQVNEGELIHYTDPSVPIIHKKGLITATIHDVLIFKYKSRTLQYYYTIHNTKQFLRLPYLISVSNYTKNSMIELGTEAEITVIPEAPSPEFCILKNKEKLRKKYNLPLDKILVLSVSSDIKRKNLKLLPEMMELLGPEFKLVRVGSPISNSITFNKMIDTELNEIYNACDVFVSPSLDEGFGLPIIEAFASGLPVVQSNIEIYREVSGKASILAEIDPISFARSVKEILNNRQLFIKRGLQRAQDYSLEMMAQETIKFYNKIQG